jgi:hypothetical protein
MAYQGNTSDFQQMRNEVNNLKTHLRRHQISMGNEKVTYTTDYREKFQSNPEGCYSHGDRKIELRKVIDDTRRCHFSLGDDKPDYLSNAHRSLPPSLPRGSSLVRSQEGVSASNSSDMWQAKEHARKMKENLQKTSFVVGFDEDYA